MNNKRAKLITWYPNLPNDWKNKEITVTYNESYGYYERGPVDISRESVENNPLLWEIIKEKDYEILAFRYENGNIWKKENDLFKNKVSFTSRSENYLLKNKSYKIYSVKRLKDGLIFSAGDFIQYDKNHHSFPKGSSMSCNIDYFTLHEGKIYVNHHHHGSPESDLNHLFKDEKPLFTTQDGVEIFEGDKYWYLTTYLALKEDRCNQFSGRRPNYKYFSTKEKAEEYKDQNELIYSKKDVRNIIEETIKRYGL